MGSKSQYFDENIPESAASGLTEMVIKVRRGGGARAAAAAAAAARASTRLRYRLPLPHAGLSGLVFGV